MPKSRYSEIDDIKKDLDSLKTNVVELTKHMKQDGAEKTAQTKGRLMELLSGLQDEGLEKYKKVEDQVREKPGKSLATAFAVGLLASVLIRRR